LRPVGLRQILGLNSVHCAYNIQDMTNACILYIAELS
jgi:hypothetical protein